MPTTSHTVQPLRPGGAETVEVDHNTYCAIQYDFFIPGAIWDHSAVRNFRSELQSVEASATIFTGATGIWEGSSEITHIYRMILRADRFSRANVRDVLHSRIGSVYAQLTTWTESTQQAIMFTETETMVSMSERHAGGS